jgi:hypothetical protein
VEVELEPLSRVAIGELVRRVATLDADAHDQVVAAADGNALLAVESPAPRPAGCRARRPACAPSSAPPRARCRTRRATWPS